MTNVILPTVRPGLFRRAIDSVFSSGKDVEVIVVSDFNKPVEDSRVKWILQPRGGTVKAINEARKHCTGDYVFLMNDESILKDNALDVLEDFCLSHNNKIIATPKHIPEFPFFYYGRRFAAFPFISRGLLNILSASIGGDFFDSRLHSFYADPDLSMRAWDYGYEVLECHDAVIDHTGQNWDDVSWANNEHIGDDRRVFSEKWSKFGELVEPVVT